MSDAAAETIEAPREKMSVAPLEWTKPDEYHIRTRCGRYTVARITVDGLDSYVAFRRFEMPDFVRAVQLDAARVSRKATDAERSAAIKRMQQKCVEDSQS